MLKSKVSNATISDLKLYYKGSISIDEEIMKEADLREGERVDVLNMNNGVRLQTYVIKGEKASGTICLNGPAARLGYKGDKIIIVSYALYTEEECKQLKGKYIQLNEKNEIENTHLA